MASAAEIIEPNAHIVARNANRFIKRIASERHLHLNDMLLDTDFDRSGGLDNSDGLEICREIIAWTPSHHSEI